MKTPSATLAALLLLAACGPAAPEPADAPSAAQPPAEAPTVEGPWRMESSATAGAALVFGDEDGVERLRLICRRGPAEFVAQAPSVTPIGSEERFTLGFGDQLFTLVADVAGDRPFVEARGPLTPELIAALRSDAPVAANYGATDIGPAPPPSPDQREALARACEAARVSGRAGA